jgi:hypothetical protein
MTTQVKAINNASEPTKYCIICRNEIEDPNSAFQTSINLSLVCQKCQEIFSPSDIELVAGIFIAFGGHFGCLKHKNLTLDEIINNTVIKRVLSDLTKQGHKKAKIEEINIRVLHQMLMHGFTPQEYITKLNKIILEK